MKKRMIVLLLAVLFLFSGCQLATEENGQSQDRLVGVFVTTEHLDLFDMESYLRDNANQLLGGGDIQLEGDLRQYERRIFLEETDEGWSFPGLDGLLYMMVSDGNGGWTHYHSEGISDVDSVQEGDSFELNGTIYLNQNTGHVCFFYNPVYVTKDGAVYLLPGQGSSTDTLAGVTMTHSFSEKTEVRNGTDSTVSKTNIGMTVKGIALPEKYVVISMNEDHQELGRETRLPGEFPERIVPAEGAAYILVECHSEDWEGNPEVTRAIYSRTEVTETVCHFKPGNQGILMKQFAVIEW